MKKYFIALFLVLFFTFFYSSYTQSEKYRNNENFIVNLYLDSKNRISDFSFIDLLINTGRFEQAKEILLTKMEKRTTFREILYLARLYLSSGNLEDAEYAYLQLEKDLPTNKDLVFIPLSELYYLKEDYKKAYEYIQKAYKLYPYDTLVLKQFAKIAEKTGNTDQALNIYRNLSKIDRNNEEYKNKIKMLEKDLKKID